MERIKVSEETVIETLRAVAAERPDYVYERQEGSAFCWYVHGDVPGCIVGHVLNRLGVPLSELAQQEGMGAHMVVPELLDTSRRARSILDATQWHQDVGSTWGYAVSEALGE